MAKPPTPLIDLHAHLPMQVKLPERSCDTKKQTARNQFLMDLTNRLFNFENVAKPHFSIDDAHDTSVSFGSVLYVPSDELFGPCDAFKNLEKQLNATTKKLKSAGYYIAKNGEDFSKNVEGGKLAAFHCLEGGFSIEEAAQVKQLREFGIAYVVLAHLLPRGVAPCVNAFPFFTDAEFERMFPQPDQRLSKRGREICIALCQHGIINDITHLTREAALEVFDIAAANRPPCPVICSHGAPQYEKGDQYKLNLDADIITRICKSGGVIGVIFSDHWLLPVGSQRKTGTIDDVVRAMHRIKEVTKTTDCIAIGCDYEGFIQPVKGLEGIRKIRDLERRLRKEFTPSEVEGILWSNAARTLKEGWK